MRFVSKVRQDKRVLIVKSFRTTGFIIYTHTYIRTPKGLIANPIRSKVTQNIRNIYLPKDSECTPSTMVSTIIYDIFISL